MNGAMIKTTIREIGKSLGRYLAILAIVLLGVGFFAGLKMTRPSMVAAERRYLKEQNFFDFRLLSTLGFTDEDVDELAQLAQISDAEGSVSVDALCRIEEGSESVYKIHQLPKRINRVVLESGRFPESPEECLLDSNLGKDALLGSPITVIDSNSQDTLDLFQTRSYTIVGTVRSPMYMNFERGTTSIGEGRVTGFCYVPAEAFDCDYLTEIYLSTTSDYDAYTEEYNDFIDALQPAIEDRTEALARKRYDDLIGDAREEIDDAQKELDDKKAEAEEELNDALKELDEAEEKLRSHEQELADGKDALASARKKLNDSKNTLSMQEEELLARESAMENMLAAAQMAQMPPARAASQQSYAGQMPPEQLQAAMLQLQAGKEQIQAGKAQIAAAEKELKEKEQELIDGEEELQQARKDLDEGWIEYEDARAEFDEEIADAQIKIDDARKELADIEEPDTYVLNRNSNIGYVCFENDSNIVAAIANVFPVFFFLVAALICMTTMNRMVEEQRTQIGVLKALGYGNGTVTWKYIFYAGSAAFIGGVVGCLAGTWLFPKTIWTAYCIMYNIGDIRFLFNGRLAGISLAAALLCSVGTTYFSCRYELTSAPANLIRPKAPRGGKRIFLERIPWIWNRMKFLRKVSMRNLFRYKKRFFMMILGISGCTALLATGFGLKDSITDIADRQYDEIQVYDLGISFSDAPAPEERASFTEETAALLDNIAFRYEESVDMDFNGKTKSLYLEVPENTESISGFLHLQTGNGEEIPYPQKGEAVLTAKIAENMGIQVGDTVTLRDNDMRQLSVTITALCENYVYNYIYINKETYENCIGALPEYKSAYASVRDGADIHETAASVSDRKDVLAVSVTLDMRSRIGKMMASMNYIVLLVIICAGFLAFIVLYNLTNINITERIREIATIKVLGFYARETSDYVFRENLLLTGMGAAVGLLLGKWLHWFVMHQINIDMVSFKTYISPGSYLYSLLLTFGFALLVNGMMFFKLEKINMAESLKSVE